MEKFVSIESVTTYFLVTALCFIFIYFSHEKINRLINIYDPIVLNIFTTANYIGVIYALCSLGHISKEFMLLYTATFVSICIGIRYGSRVSIRYRQVSPCESIFNVDYFILICLFSLYASCVNGRNSFETWSMNGSPHLNRIAIMMGNMTASYFARAASYPVNVYLFLSIIVSKKRWIRLVASFLILSAISLGVVDGSRAAIFGFVFQASVAYFLYQGKYGKNGKKYGSLFLYLLLLAIVTMVFLTVIKERFEEVPKGILFSIAERLVYSADNVIYYHIYLRENFDPKISNPFLYIFHPLLRLFGQRGVTGGIGQSMAYALFQKKTGAGPMASYIYDGLFVFGKLGMIVYAWFVGFIIALSRNILVTMTKSGLIYKDFFFFFFSVSFFFMGPMLINDLLTFMCYFFVTIPILALVLLLTRLPRKEAMAYGIMDFSR